MHNCPWCSAAAVSNFAVRWSSRSSPASCTGCGKLSHVLGSTSSGIATIGFLLLCFVAVGGFVLQSYWVGLAGVGVVVVYNVWAWRQSELFPISPEGASTAKKAGWWVVALYFLASLFS
jgi:hypothetical protein